MGKGAKRTSRDDEEERAPRLRTKSTEEMEEEEKAHRGAAADADSADEEGEWIDDDFEDDEEEIIDDGADDDDEYAEFQKESAGAVASGVASMSLDAAGVGEDGDGEEAAEEEVKIWRNDQDTEYTGEMEYENRAYDSFLQLRTEYPCLSFDIVRDNDGGDRTKYPLSMMMVCGSYADKPENNHLLVCHVSNICRTKHDVESDGDSEADYIGDGGDSEGEDDDEDDTNVNNGEPVLNQRTIRHHGSANRVRCSPHGNLENGGHQLVAVWSDAGHVQVFDLDHDLRALTDHANWSKEQAKAWANPKQKPQPLKFCTPSTSHRTEGYGLDWSPISANVFASGDCDGSLYVWQPTDDGRWDNVASSVGDGAKSVEEIQWSPTQDKVLITARAGGMVEVWDVRDMRGCKKSWRADAQDVNVASWNRAREASHLLVTGSDSGAVAVWDLRKLQEALPIQQLQWHKKSITSVEFSLHNQSALAVTSTDGQCTLWDLSLERDPSEEQQVIGELFGREDLTNLPDQLLFQHQGLVDPKEAHWHRQIPGMVVTTDFNGFHLFRPMNWRSLVR